MPYLESYIYEAPGLSSSLDAVPLSATTSYPITLIISTIITSGIVYPFDATKIPRGKKRKRNSTTNKIPLQSGEFQVATTNTEIDERNSFPEWFWLFLASRPINLSTGDHGQPTLPGEKFPFIPPFSYPDVYTESTTFQPKDTESFSKFDVNGAQGFIFLRLLIALLCVFCLLTLFCLIQIILYVSRYRPNCLKFAWRKTQSSSYDTSMVHDMGIENGHSCEVEMEDFDLSPENDSSCLLPANSCDCSNKLSGIKSKAKGEEKGIKEDVYDSEVSLAPSDNC
jgi:hypothetical protein